MLAFESLIHLAHSEDNHDEEDKDPNSPTVEFKPILEMQNNHGLCPYVVQEVRHLSLIFQIHPLDKNFIC